MTACGFRGGLRAGTFSWQTAGQSEREALLPELVGPELSYQRSSWMLHKVTFFIFILLDMNEYIISKDKTCSLVQFGSVGADVFHSVQSPESCFPSLLISFLSLGCLNPTQTWERPCCPPSVCLMKLRANWKENLWWHKLISPQTFLYKCLPTWRFKEVSQITAVIWAVI